MRHEARTNRAISRHKLQGTCRNSGLEQKFHRCKSDQRRLLGGLCDHAIAGGKRGGNLPQKNRQRKIPRADAHENAPPAMDQTVLLARRPRQQNALAAHTPRLFCVITAEIHRLAHFRKRVIQRLSRFKLQKMQKAAPPRFQQIGGLLQRPRALLCRQSGKCAKPAPRRVNCRISQFRRCLRHRSDAERMINRRHNKPPRSRALLAVNQSRSMARRVSGTVLDLVLQSGKALRMAEFHTARIPSLRAIKINRQWHFRMPCRFRHADNRRWPGEQRRNRHSRIRRNRHKG